jgi:MGT family glycosyltransferase
MPERGHVSPAVAFGRELVMAGAKVHAFSTQQFSTLFRAADIEFHDLYEKRPIDEADASSIPVPCRYVTFAATFGDSLSESIGRLRPDIIVYESFAVVALVVSRKLGIPAVSIIASHNMPPGQTIAELERDPRVDVSQACRDAVEQLQSKYGIADASPFSYANALSPLLNVIPEPEQFYLSDETTPFAPCVFFGCIDINDRERASHFPGGPSQSRANNIYACFGTVASRYYQPAIVAAIKAIADAARQHPEMLFTISLGGYQINEIHVPSNVRILPFVDQWEILQQSEVYITHHGMNSTHEAVYLKTPMISYPLLYDQPKLALRCQQLGLAVPLVKELRAKFEAADLINSILDVRRDRAAMIDRLETAHHWELQAVEKRGDAVQQVLDLA